MKIKPISMRLRLYSCAADKTGTLTENRMTVVAGWFPNKLWESLPGAEDLHPQLLQDILLNAALNSKVTCTAATMIDSKSHFTYHVMQHVHRLANMLIKGKSDSCILVSLTFTACKGASVFLDPGLIITVQRGLKHPRISQAAAPGPGSSPCCNLIAILFESVW